MAGRKNRKDTGGDIIRATIGDNANQVAVGKDIIQKQVSHGSDITESDLTEVRRLFSEYKTEIEKNVPPNKRQAALERVAEIEDDLVNKRPTSTTFGYFKNWIVKYAPSILGGLISIVVNPIVGKVVEAGGEMAANEFRRRFGS